MSVIIIGIGNADFDTMDDLDSDKGLLYSKLEGKHALRDVVQFVPLRKFANNYTALSSAVLKELPMQISKYFGTIGTDYLR